MLSTFTGSFAFGRRTSGRLGFLAGSVDMRGGNSTFLKVNNDAAFAAGTGDFTYEWWQYADAYSSYTRVMSIGTYFQGPTLAISLEGIDSDRTMNVWVGGTGGGGIATVGTTLSTWVHFALVRSSGVLKLYKNGINISGSGVSNPSDMVYNSGQSFAIGAETSDGYISYGNTAFTGKMTGIHYTVGTALYNTDFSLPIEPPTVTANTELLLNFRSYETFLTDESSTPKIITTVGSVSASAEIPY